MTGSIARFFPKSEWEPSDFVPRRSRHRVAAQLHYKKPTLLGGHIRTNAPDDEVFVDRAEDAHSSDECSIVAHHEHVTGRQQTFHLFGRGLSSR
jgi:hypothetical protein